MRWRIERDYQELKQETGLRHYEGRGWPMNWPTAFAATRR
jgi:SRSO17 transposase